LEPVQNSNLGGGSAADKRHCRVQGTLPLEFDSPVYTFRFAPCAAKFLPRAKHAYYIKRTTSSPSRPLPSRRANSHGLKAVAIQADCIEEPGRCRSRLWQIGLLHRK